MSSAKLNIGPAFTGRCSCGGVINLQPIPEEQHVICPKCGTHFTLDVRINVRVSQMITSFTPGAGRSRPNWLVDVETKPGFISAHLKNVEFKDSDSGDEQPGGD
jgi:hypothetical protein